MYSIWNSAVTNTYNNNTYALAIAYNYINMSPLQIGPVCSVDNVGQQCSPSSLTTRALASLMTLAIQVLLSDKMLYFCGL